MQLYHCHSTPLKKHIHKGLYGAFIIDPPQPRAPAQELVMVMNGFDTDGDGEKTDAAGVGLLEAGDHGEDRAFARTARAGQLVQRHDGLRF